MTVRAITAPELVKLRGDNQYSEVFVIPRVPNVIYSADVAVVPTSNDMVFEVEIDNGIGDDAEIRADMKILVGTSPGSDDLGFCRLRSVPTIVSDAGTLEVGEMSHIDWSSATDITIVDDYDIMPRHLKIINNVSYIDYSEAYTDQHSVFDPVIVMGGARVLVLSSGTVNHVRDATDSFVFDGSVSSYLWEAPNASSIDTPTASSATFTYTTAGHFCEYLTITTDGGKTFTGVRYVFVLSANPTASTITSLTVSENPIDGVEFEFDMPQGASITDFKHRAFVVAWARTYYQGAESYISYANEYESNIIASGRISNEQLTFNDNFGNVKFTANNWKFWMGKIAAFPFGLERPASGTASSWTDMPNLTVDKAVFELLHRYCTVTRICDFHKSGDTRYAAELSCANSNLAGQIEELALTSIYADLVFDRYGSGYLRVEPQLIPVADRSGWAVVQEITSDDYETGISTELNTYDDVSQIALSGVVVPQYGLAYPVFSLSYGRVPSPYGDLGSEDTLLLSSQDEANSLAGIMMSWQNRLFDTISIKFVGQNFMFSCAEYCKAYINITNAGNPRGISYDGYLSIRGIEYSWDAESGFIETSVDFQDESAEKISVTGDFPPETEIDNDFSVPSSPSIKIPSFPPIFNLPPSTENPLHPKKVVMASAGSFVSTTGVFYTVDCDETNPNWLTMNDGIDPADLADMEYANIIKTPSGALYMVIGNDASLPYGKNLYRASVLGGTWQLVADGNALAVGIYGGVYGENIGNFMGIGFDPTQPDTVYASFYANAYIGIGAGTCRLAVITGGAFSLKSEWADATAGAKKHGVVVLDGKVFVSFSRPDLRVAELTTGGSLSTEYVVNTLVVAGQTSLTPKGADMAAWALDAGGTPSYDVVETDGTATSVNTSFDPRGSNMQSIVFSPDGQVGMGTGVSPFTPYKTTDGGASWSSVSGVIPVGSDVWENCGDNNRFLFGGGTVLRLTMDVGATYLDKSGNLSLIAPLMDVVAIRFVS